MGSHAADTDVVQTAILNSVVMANTPTGKATDHVIALQDTHCSEIT